METNNIFFFEREHLPFTETAENKLAIDGGYRGGHATNRWPAGGAATLLGPHALMETSFFLSFFNLVLATPRRPPTAGAFLPDGPARGRQREKLFHPHRWVRVLVVNVSAADLT